MGEITLNIDGREVETVKGKTVLEAALSAGIYIPHLCYHPDLNPLGACRLCVIEIEGIPGFPSACTTPVTEGMVVKTKTSQINQLRNLSMELMLANHPPDCTTCPKYLNCELQSLKQYLGVIEEQRLKKRTETFPVDTSNPLFLQDFGRCILCGRCVRACYELRGAEVLSFIDRGSETLIGTAFERSLADAGCMFCGACVEVCPTGAVRDQEGLIKPGKSRRAALIPCQDACPVGIDVPRYVRLIAEGRYDESYAVVREKLPLPCVCSYICLSYCEEECRRTELNEPVGIRELKRFVSDNHSDLWKKNLKPHKETEKKVAILGSGPAGLTAAYYLSRKGHCVTIHEQAPLAGGMLRQAISRKRLPREALEDDIQEILNTGVTLKLNAGDMRIGQLLDNEFDVVFLAIGSTFVGSSASWLKEEGIELTPWGNIDVDTYNMTTNRESVFAGGDAILAGISEDFIRYASNNNYDDFFTVLIDGLASSRGDSFRSVTRAIASGKKAAEAIDRHLGGDGDIAESLLPTEETSPYLGRQEGFACRERIPARYNTPVPQFAGLSRAEPFLSEEEATNEAGRCLRCDLRLKITRVKFWTDYSSH